ncbi:WXG100 family type VII secretion target [Streptomyces cavernicola]|uniref:WXG100 family type VII secretion target n=1 Tax=Streptomyces cavernicola TaxID=3043613 RepID=A0ABT6SHK3_9ACTN|nr:WXG100 family type VII secretion target [Streptomyces sp. B-S-A6]MDI3407650.1 WXG100 family type VII secretion target [Streptomyces sp. B-S-A6]
MAVQKVNDEVLRGFEQELNDRFGSVKTQLQQLQAVIDGVEGKWKGMGAVSFDRKQREINERMAHIGNLLVRFQQAVDDNRRIAGSTEQEVFQALKGIDVGSGSSSGSSGSSSFNNM